MKNFSMKSIETDDPFNYVFTAVRGIQAGREYYIAMCPLKLIPKIFVFNEEEIPASLRAQRTLNKARIPEMSRYIFDNPENYTFSSLTASIDGKVQFQPIDESGVNSKVGYLIIPMSSKFLINDGQHRRAAIEVALKIRPELGNETMSVVFFLDAGLKRSQQMFSDLNKHAIRPTKSLGILYDHKDEMAKLCLDLSESVPIFKGRVEMEKTSISNRSLKLFTLSSVYTATKELLGKRTKRYTISDEERKLAQEFWSEVSSHVKEWQLLMENKVTSAELRKDYIHSHGIGLLAFGVFGESLIEKYPSDWKKRLVSLEKIDWLRSNRTWEGKAMVGGRISAVQTNITLTAIELKKAVGVPLTDYEIRLEKKVNSGGG